MKRAPRAKRACCRGRRGRRGRGCCRRRRCRRRRVRHHRGVSAHAPVAAPPRHLARPARRRARQPGPRVRAQPPQPRLAGRRRARAAARRLLAREVQRPARRDQDRRPQGRPAQARDVHERLGTLGAGGDASSSSSIPTRCSSSTTRAISTSAGCRRGSAAVLAGHNGLRSIKEHLGTPDFLRLRVGVGRPGRGDQRKLADYLLADFAPRGRPGSASSGPPRTPSRRSTPRGSKRPSARSTANAVS